MPASLRLTCHTLREKLEICRVWQVRASERRQTIFRYCFEPVPKGRWLDAVASGAGLIPYPGDIVSLGKFPRYMRMIREAIQVAASDASFAAQFKERRKLVLSKSENSASVRAYKDGKTDRFFFDNQCAGHACSGAEKPPSDLLRAWLKYRMMK